MVNEVIDESQADGLRRSEWYRVLGPSYIADAFRYARAAFGPEVLLFINDYNSEYPDKRAPYLRLVTDLLAQGWRSDGVGTSARRGRPLDPDDRGHDRGVEALDVTQVVTALDVPPTRHAGETWTARPPTACSSRGPRP